MRPIHRTAEAAIRQTRTPRRVTVAASTLTEMSRDCTADATAFLCSRTQSTQTKESFV